MKLMALVWEAVGSIQRTGSAFGRSDSTQMANLSTGKVMEKEDGRNEKERWP
jgi:hypothetical protein